MTDQQNISEAVESLIGKKPFKLIIPIISPDPLPKRSLLDKILRKPLREVENQREIVITSCVVGNMFRIANRALLLPTEIYGEATFDTIIPIIKDHIADVTYIVACSIQNNEHEPDENLIRFINNNFIVDNLYDCFFQALDHMGMQSFLNSIVLARGTVQILNPSASPLDGRE